MKKADLKSGAYIINYKEGNIFKIHNILEENGKQIVWLVDTVTEKVSAQGYNTVLKNYKLANYQKVDEKETKEDIIEEKEDKFKEFENLEPEKVTVPDDKERPNLEAIFNRNREMELNGGNNMKDVKKKKKKRATTTTKGVETKKETAKAPKDENKKETNKAPKKTTPKKEKVEDVTTLQEILDQEIEAGNIPEMDSKKARRLIRSRCPELKELTVDGSKWEFDKDNLEEATEMIVAKLGK